MNLTHWLISTQVARTTEFGGRVVRLLYALENDHERKEGTVALVSARMSMRACLDARLTGPVAERPWRRRSSSPRSATSTRGSREPWTCISWRRSSASPSRTPRRRVPGAGSPASFCYFVARLP